MKQTLEELMERCVQYFERQSYSVPRIACYKSLWRSKLMPYMAKQLISHYDASVGEGQKFIGMAQGSEKIINFMESAIMK